MTEPALRFLPLGIDLNSEEEDALQKIHAALERLTRRRKGRVPVSKVLFEEVLREALLYRIVAATSGVIVSWNAGNVLCSFLAARALFETFAYLWDYRRTLTAARQNGTLDELEELTVKRLAATKNPEWIERYPAWEATNILTFINRLSKEYPGLRKAYDEMSFRCHPNTEGLFYMYADIDPDEKGVNFSNHNEHAGWAFRLVIAVAGLIIDAENIFDWLEETAPKIADELLEKRFMQEAARAARDEKIFSEFVKEEEKALMGHAEGQFNIGNIYAIGCAMVPKNLVRAYMWFSLSAKQGSEKARDGVNKLTGSMTIAEVAEANALANDWKPLTPKQIAENDSYWREYWRERMPKASDWS